MKYTIYIGENIQSIERDEDMKTKIYVAHSDGGHGWLAVKRAELEEMNLLDKITACSYQRGKTVYLEEDCDLSLFVREYEKRFGTRPLMRESYRDRSPIRGYERFKTEEKKNGT